MKKHLRTIAFVLVLTLLTGTLPTELFSFEVVAAQEGYTSNAPFTSESMHNSYFCSPALVTRGDGVLLAAADATWATDSRTGADTVTSISSDGGAVWKWHYANYLGDNGDQSNASSTSFRDSALAVQGNTAYLLVELYPGGVTANSDAARFDDAGRLLLTKDSESYYLADGKIYKTDGDTQVDGYTVDEYFDLYNNGTHESNLFFSNAAYKVAQTGFLYLTKSTDGGKTWAAPTLLNVQNSGAPASGRGVVTSDGTIIFPICEENGTLGFLSSTDGATWSSVQSSISASAAAVVQMGDALRFFYSDGTNLCYVDYKDDTWGAPVATDVVCSATSRISAVTYPQKVNGQTAVIVSCASSDTSSGQLVALTDGESAMSQLNTYSVTGGYFADSCLTLTQDGRAALLYESAAGEIAFARADIEDVLGAQAVIGDDPYFADEAGHRVTAITLISKKGSEQVTLKNPNNAAVAEPTSSDETVVTAAYAGGKLTLTPSKQGTATVTLTVGETALTLRVTVEEYLTENITLTVGETATVVLDGQFDEGNTLPSDDSVVNVTTALINEAVTEYAQEPFPDGEYCICTSRSEHKWPLTAETAESGTRLTIDTKEVTTASVHWKFEKQTDGTYYVSCNGQYLNVGSNNSDDVTVSSTPQKLFVKMDAEKWYIQSATYTRYLNQWEGPAGTVAGAWTALDDGSHWYLYQYSASGTQVTFSGVSEGGALAIVGYTKFNIKVKLPEKHLVTTVGKSVTIKASGADAAVKSTDFDASVTMATNSETITFTGVAATGKTLPSVVLNGTRYYITVLSEPPATLTSETTPILGTAGEANGNPVTALGIGTGEVSAYTLSVASGKEVYWCSSDETVCTVDENGVVTGTYSGDDPYAEATVTALIDGVPYSIPVTVWKVNNETTTKKTIDIYSYEVIHSRSYYSLWAHGLHDFPEGAYLNIVMDSTHAYALNFFGAPEDGYVLTYCSQPGSNNEYFTFESGDDTIYTRTSGWGSSIGVTQDDVQKMLEEAKAAGAQGAFFNTRTSSSDNADLLHMHNLIASEKLPTVEKTLAGVLRQSANTFHSYAGARMTAEVGDYVYFTITVTQEAPEVWNADVDANGNKHGLLTYSDATLLDTLTKGKGECSFYSAADDSDGGGWIDSAELSQKDITDQLNASWSQAQIEAGKRELVYYVVYKVSDADLALTKDEAGNIQPQIVNTVDLSYSYTSRYSNQTGENEANAEANVLVVGKYIGQYVIDFGLPLQITITGKDSGFAYVNTGAEKWFDSAYGTLSLEKDEENAKYTLTYTPAQILSTSDEVLIYREERDESGNEKITVNSLTIVPATSVYYEDTFINGWESKGTAGTLHQDADILGDRDDNQAPIKNHPYGFDAAYSDAFSASGGTWLEATVVEQDGEKDFADGPTASFTFTGTGFELYAICTAETGTVRVEITPTVSGKLGSYIVDTKVRVGESNATSGQTGDYCGLPIVSVTDLPWGSYTVTLKKLRADGVVKLDGVRIHGTVKEAAGKDSLYFADREDHPEYFELRDYVLRAMGVANLGQTLQTVADQVYGRSYSAIVFDTTVPYGEGTVQDLLQNGPKNELFLWKGQSVTFKVKTSRLMQLGMKAPQGATSAEITLGDASKTVNINSAVDMFYELDNTQGTEREWSITVTNTSENVLSLTKLKICDDPDAAIVPLTDSDVNDALISLGALTESDRAEAIAEVVLVDHAGNRLATATLRRAGLNGVTTVFSASAILDAARAALPEHYAIVNESVVTHAAVACGSTRTVFVQVGQVATVEVTYISVRTRRVCTVTVTKVQFEDGACRISAAELMRLSPLGRALLSTCAISVPYGQTCAVTVLVL